MADSTETRGPETPLERAVYDLRDGSINLAQFCVEFSRAMVVVPLGADDEAGRAPLLPVLIAIGDGPDLAIAFSSREVMRGQVAAAAPFTSVMSGIELVRRLPSGRGIMLNPQTASAFALSAQVVAILANADAEVAEDTRRETIDLIALAERCRFIELPKAEIGDDLLVFSDMELGIYLIRETTGVRVETTSRSTQRRFLGRFADEAGGRRAIAYWLRSGASGDPGAHHEVHGKREK